MEGSISTNPQVQEAILTCKGNSALLIMTALDNCRDCIGCFHPGAVSVP